MFTKKMIQQAVRKFGCTWEYTDVHPDNVKRFLCHWLKQQGARVEQIGESRSGKWPLWGVVVGDESKPTITLTGNCHSEEVVGTITILNMLNDMLAGGVLAPLLKEFRIVAIPQMNPDGVMQNQSWIQQPDPMTYLGMYYRDHRGADVEHGIAMAGESHQRSEPKALTEFYLREAAGRTAVYITFHSCNLEAGAFFMSGNEDEGMMAPAFRLIRELAPRCGLHLMTENLNGYEHFRKISDGVYSVPRREEMTKGFLVAGASAEGFLTNSVEWMESHGTTVSLVSEVPTTLAGAYQEVPLLGYGSALELMEEMVVIYANHVQEFGQLIEQLNGPLRSEVANEIYLENITRHYELRGHREDKHFAQFLPCFADQPALRIHQAKLDSLPHMLALRRAGIMVAVLKDGDTRNDFQQGMKAAYSILDEELGLSMTPVAAQVKLQTLLVLAGAYAYQKNL